MPHTPPTIPTISPWLWKGFGQYARRYTRRHFHAVQLMKDSPFPQPPSDGPLIVCLNHASWWDPMIALLLARQFLPTHKHYAPIDAQSLKQFAFFKKLGFFGVEQDSRRGALTFLRTASAICQSPSAVLWITPQGRFTDPRHRPITLRPGIGHLLHQLPKAALLPLAIEYPFWQDRLPHALIRCGPLQTIAPGSAHTAQEWTATISRSLEETQDHLATAAIAQRPEAFTPLLGGSSGINFFYDLWQNLVVRTSKPARTPLARSTTTQL